MAENQIISGVSDSFLESLLDISPVKVLQSSQLILDIQSFDDLLII